MLKSDRIENPILAWVQKVTLQNDPKETSVLKQKLRFAGIDNPGAPAAYVAARMGLATSLPIGFALLQTTSAHPILGSPLILCCIGLCAAGMWAPKIYLGHLVSHRQETLEFSFPDMLDLLLVCVEAGYALEGAILRVGAETAHSHPALSNELRRISQELRAGKSRPDALKAFAERTNVDSIRTFVALLIQSDSLGVSLGGTIRTFATELREKRFSRAEEKAMRIPVLMTLPLVACMLPVIVLTIMLPPAIDIIRNLQPALTGGK